MNCSSAGYANGHSRKLSWASTVPSTTSASTWTGTRRAGSTTSTPLVRVLRALCGEPDRLRWADQFDGQVRRAERRHPPAQQRVQGGAERAPLTGGHGGATAKLAAAH